MNSAGFRSELRRHDVVRDRIAEIERYEKAYQTPEYGAGKARLLKLTDWLNEEDRLFYDGFLDVSCGRGDSLDLAKKKGFLRVQGTEVVKSLAKPGVCYAEAHDLPFDTDSFDVVVCLDVFEHLLPLDVEAACYEIGRVAKQEVLISVSNEADGWGPKLGLGPLHITRWPYNVWYHAIEDWCGEKFHLRYRADLAGDNNMFFQLTRRLEYDQEQLDLL